METEPIFFGLFSTQLVLGSVGVAFNTLMLLRLSKSQHKLCANTAFLLLSNTLAMVLRSIFTSVRALALIMIGQRLPVDSEFAAKLCGALDMPRLIADSIIGFGLFVIALERLINIKQPVHDELARVKVWVQVSVLSLILFSTVLVGVIVVWSIHLPSQPTRHCLLTHLTTAMNSNAVIFIVLTFSTVEVISILLFGLVWRCCRLQQHLFANAQDCQSLANRVRLRRTVQLTKTVWPAVAAHAVMVFVALVVLSSRVTLPILDHPTVSLLLGEVSDFIPVQLYALWYAYCMMRLLNLLNGSLFSHLHLDPDHNPSKYWRLEHQEADNENQVSHFACLEDQWSAAYDRMMQQTK